MATDESMIVLLTGRAAVYRVFQETLGNEPNTDMLERLASPQTQEVLQLFAEETSSYMQMLDALRAFVQEQTQDMDSLAKKLSGGFTRLFVGPGAVDVPPWESVYLDKHNALFQPSTLEVRKAYVAQGFLPEQYPHVADDHIALELDFMAKVAEKAVEAFSSGEKVKAKEHLIASKDFIEQHLLVWVPAFTKKLREVKSGYFYSLIGDLLEAFLPVDHEAINEIVEVLA